MSTYLLWIPQVKEVQEALVTHLLVCGEHDDVAAEIEATCSDSRVGLEQGQLFTCVAQMGNFNSSFCFSLQLCNNALGTMADTGFTYQSHSPIAGSCCLLILSKHFLCPLRTGKLRKPKCATSSTLYLNHKFTEMNLTLRRKRVLTYIYAFLKKDTVTVDTPHSSCVSIVGAKSLAIDGVPRIHYLQWERHIPITIMQNNISHGVTLTSAGMHNLITLNLNSPCL